MNEPSSLRETKFARTKLALLDSVIELIGQNKAFDEISVLDICGRAGVSYATFFNYFKTKADVLVYFIQLWSVEVSARAQRISAGHGGLKAIEEIFDYTARLSEKDPGMLGEIIAVQARGHRKGPPVVTPLTRAEKKLRFPDLDDSTEVAEMGLQSVLPLFLKQAIKKGELPKRANINDLVLALSAVFFGVPVAVGAGKGSNLRAHYKKQLQLIWAAARYQEAK
jgi:AcrR family transcriptional regulator